MKSGTIYFLLSGPVIQTNPSGIQVFVEWEDVVDEEESIIEAKVKTRKNNQSMVDGLAIMLNFL